MPVVEAVIHVVAFALGAALAVRTMLSAIRAFVLPRASNDNIARPVFRVSRRLFDLVATPDRPYLFRDRILAYYAPVTLIVVLIYWIVLLALGYAAMFWAIGAGTAAESINLSGSSVLTLGFASSPVPGANLLSFSEAILGLILIALLIAYLPTIYGAFSRRELLVDLLEVRADTPPSAVVLLTRFERLRGLDALHQMWERWEQWFSELGETHTALPVLVFYRSPKPEHSWVNAAGAIMDTAALARSALDLPVDVQADLTIRAGYLALRRIADFFNVGYDPNPRQTDPTSIGRERFDEVLAVLAASGVPLKADREQAWRDFNGWRVNYDTVLVALARMTMAPPSWWDRPMVSAYATDEPVTGDIEVSIPTDA
jgi:hypothetical protein